MIDQSDRTGHGLGNRHRLGVVDFNPIQYHTPLYQLITRRARIELDVLFLADGGQNPVMDPGFGIPISWDIDLLSGYGHRFLMRPDRSFPTLSRMADLAGWISEHDAVVIHGYSNKWMLLTALLCRARRVPYLLRGDSTPQGQATGLRQVLRGFVVRKVVSASAAGLSIGQLNEEFYKKFGAPRTIWAPYSVDDKRFGSSPPISRADLLTKWNLDASKPVILFCGKMYPGKRPLDLVAAAKLLPRKVNTIFVGDGVQADDIRSSLVPGEGVVTGFVNQSDLPAYYHAADIIVLPSEAEKWGLVINEAMAAGVIPIVSDRVGAAPDLAYGIGEVYPCGDLELLVEALRRALALVGDPEIRNRVRQHAARYSLECTATGFEDAVFAVAGT